jgi:hypothetical protein
MGAFALERIVVWQLVGLLVLAGSMLLGRGRAHVLD